MGVPDSACIAWECQTRLAVQGSARLGLPCEVHEGWHARRVRAFLQRFAQERDLRVQADSAGNVVIKRRGINGGEAAAPVIVQVLQS